MNEIQAIAVKPKQGGYTLVELAIAIAILSVLIIAGLSGVQSILVSGKVNDQIKTVAKLGAKVSSFYANGTSGVTAAELARNGGWDSSKYSITGTGTAATATINSSFGTTETITSNTAAIGDIAANTAFIYTIKAVPKSACADLANGLSGLVYAIYISANNATTTATANWVAGSTNTSLVKEKAGTNLITANLASSCDAGSTLDFQIALKP